MNFQNFPIVSSTVKISVFQQIFKPFDQARNSLGTPGARLTAAVNQQSFWLYQILNYYFPIFRLILTHLSKNVWSLESKLVRTIISSLDTYHWRSSLALPPYACILSARPLKSREDNINTKHSITTVVIHDAIIKWIKKFQHYFFAQEIDWLEKN